MNVTVQGGSVAHLNCRISMLQDKTVPNHNSMRLKAKFSIIQNLYIVLQYIVYAPYKSFRYIYAQFICGKHVN